MSMGENVKRLRNGRSMSQEELATAINVHQTHISSIERNGKNPSLEIVQRLATYFGVSLDVLVNGEPVSIVEAEIA